MTGPGFISDDYRAIYSRVYDQGQQVSDLIGEMRIMYSYSTLALVSYGYEPNRDLKTDVQNNKTSGSTFSRYTYAYDALGRRTSVINRGLEFGPAELNKWGYNPKSELLSSHRYEGENPDSPGTEIMAEQRLYDYDQIGNRLDSTEGTGTATTYGANDVNRYDWVQPGSDPREYLCYDDDGNLKREGKLLPECPGPGTDGLHEFKWDAENRLVEIAPVTPSNDPPSNKRVKFVYDYMGRRVRKTVDTYNGAWAETSDELFVYDGWNVVMVTNADANDVNATAAITRKYTWGLDLSQSIHGAGGVGGLLACEEPQAEGDPKRYWFFYDANGNVGQVMDANDPWNLSLAAKYEYDPYGSVINSDGPYADANPMQFSTKWFDAETGLGYWGYRYYSPRLGRWLSRDPIGELGSLNLLAFLMNGPVNSWDYLGLLDRQDVKKGISWLITWGAERCFELIEMYGGNLDANKIAWINKQVATIKLEVAPYANVDTKTMKWFDLFIAWFFEFGDTPFEFRSGDWTTTDLQHHEGVNEAREKATHYFVAGGMTPVSHQWTYGVPQFWSSISEIDSAAIFLGSYATKVTRQDDGCTLVFEVDNKSGWTSATRFRKAKKPGGSHLGVIPDRERTDGGIKLGGTITEHWQWSEILQDETQ